MTAADTPPAPGTVTGAPLESLGSGAAGTALHHIVRARAGSGTWVVAHESATAMTRRPVTAHPDSAGLYRGAPAAGYVLHTGGHAAYDAALTALDRHVTTLTRRRLDQAHQRIDQQRPPALREYDLISGLTGLGVQLLHRDRHPELLRDVLGYLMRLTEPLHHDGDRLPGWWCAHSPTDHPAPAWAGGHGNLGLAHGITGPLALLATAAGRGIVVDGYAEAIGRIGDWLDRWRVGAGTSAWWPGRITRHEHQSGGLRQTGPQRPSWCYGTPGIARAQQLAALALHDHRRQRAAEDALTGCVTDPDQLAHLHDATLCHGLAGLLLTTWRAAADARTAALHDSVPGLRDRLARHLEHHGPPPGPGLLDGHDGIDLIRDTLDRPSTARWDLCLLTSG